MKALWRILSRGMMIGCATAFLFLSVTHASDERPFTYYEYDGVFVFYKTDDTALYRALLPKEFEMPAQPLVRVFFMDYYKMDKATRPYREAAVYLLAAYKQKPGWVCLTMPVTSHEARIGGIIVQGYPKIMGDVKFQRESSKYSGKLVLKNKTVMDLEFIPGEDKTVSQADEAWFKRFHGLGDFNILNGKVFEPQFGGKDNILRVARTFPDKLVIRTGQARLMQDAEAARAYSEDMGRIFSLKPAGIVLAYYIRNSFKMNFGAGNYPDQQ